MVVLKVQKRIVGPEHPDTLVSIDNLALTYENQEKWNEAKALQVEVLEVLEVRRRVGACAASC